ncbi:extracellular solute-binding protein [Paenibacillus sp. D2_2]|uniref:extracellular solute-binding protein n=1 Tax=Paenibacillus sp. D2_2 TaxID=3073092 RepID=UPI0028157ACB|nr:extracellular solute-binding protein [Paenibacillus sp. D2_2]WMT39710.1 extracellular solute-binding protein [Paenibacillus sp. D2_2]
MKNRVSKFLSCIMSIILISGTLVACTDTKQNESNPPASENNLLDGGITNATGFPITKEPITLTVGIANGAHMGDFTQYNLWKKIEKKTNIKINLKVYSDAEKANLMFSSRDYPDIGFRMDASEQAMSDAIDAGDIVGIDDLLQYAPSWKKFFDTNPEQKKQALMPDGKLYGFPYAVLNETSYNLRDQWFINKKWLDELGLQIPTTTDEFKNVLMAFKNNAGKGSIPKNVIPYYILYGNNIGGQFDMYGAFGVYTQAAISL